MKFLGNLLEGYDSYMTHLSRVRAREVLLKSSDRLLKDAGFSRELLESGVQAWPWRKVGPELAPLHFRQLGHSNVDQGTSEINNHGDKALHDFSGSEGSVVDVVMSSRDNIAKSNRERKVA